jgi:carboxyl-terminal processing protease
MPQPRLTVLLALLAGLIAGCAAPRTQAGPAASAITQDLALLTFDSAWSRISDTHYDPAFGGLDWGAVRTELRPRAAEAGTLGALRRVIDEMLERLGDSHYVLIPREVADALDGNGEPSRVLTGDAGLAVRLVGDEIVTWRVDAGRAAARAGIGTGWVLLEIDNRTLAERVRALQALPAAERRTALTRLLYRTNAELSGETGKTLLLRLRDARGDTRDIPLVLEPSRGEVVRFGNLPPVLAVLEYETVPAGSGCAGVIRLNAWVVPLVGAFDDAVDAVRHCAGVIIDLRGNPGGIAGMVMGTAGHFLDEPVPLGFMRTRTNELRFRANPRRVRANGSPMEPFAGPLAILVDEMSASTSEFFAGGMQGIGRARVFGTPTAGQALPAAMLRLPTQDVLMHVIADFTGPHGVRIEGRGVLPDVTIAPSRDDLLQGRDAALLAALDWITRSADRRGTTDREDDAT